MIFNFPGSQPQNQKVFLVKHRIYKPLVYYCKALLIFSRTLHVCQNKRTLSPRTCFPYPPNSLNCPHVYMKGGERRVKYCSSISNKVATDMAIFFEHVESCGAVCAFPEIFPFSHTSLPTKYAPLPFF